MLLAEKVPATLEEAVDGLFASLTDEDRQHILDPSSSPGQMHFNGGMALRNVWGLWHDSPLAQHFKNVHGLGHADDMSAIILKALWAKVREEAFGIDAEVSYYKDYWRREGIDPLTQARVA